jgi:hypothetical protein
MPMTVGKGKRAITVNGWRYRVRTRLFDPSVTPLGH